MTLKAPRMKPFMAMALALSLALAPGFFSNADAQLFSKRKPGKADRSDLQKPVQRNFLPPVAVINGPVDDSAGTAAPSDTDDQDIQALELDAEKPTLTLSGRPAKLDDKVQVGDADQLQFLTKQQQALDKDDYNKLWASTVERNPVIQFALEKVTTPADLAPSVSSQMYKRVASMAVQGLTVGAMTMLPAGDYARMGTAAAGQAIDNLISGRTKQPTVTLSDTEKIQLAQLLEELNGSLLSDYHSYKNTLMLLSDMQQSVINKNNEYSKAIKSGNDVAMMAAATAYYKAAKNQTELRQKAKLHRMKLERLAGVDAVKDLQLALFSPDKAGENAAGAGGEGTPEPVLGDANLVKLEPAPQADPKTEKDDVIAAPAVLQSEKLQPNAAQLEQLKKLDSIIGPPEPEAAGEMPEEIGPKLEDLDQTLNDDDGKITADDFRKASDVQSTLESGRRIGIGEDGGDSPLPINVDEAMPVLRRVP